LRDVPPEFRKGQIGHRIAANLAVIQMLGLAATVVLRQLEE